jgi:exonuclease III
MSDAAPEASRQVSILTYNVFLNALHAVEKDLPVLQSEHNSDFMCLQECAPDSEAMASLRVGPLHTAATTEKGRYGLAILYNPERFDLLHKEIVPLKIPLTERVNEQMRALGREATRQRLLVAQFRDCALGQVATVGCFHASQLPATNAHRRQQIDQALVGIQGLGDEHTQVLVGDYNYPFSQKGLRRHIERHGYDLVIPDKSTYISPHWKGYTLDLAATKNAENATIEVINKEGSDLFSANSDHLPVKVTLEFPE